MSKAPVHHAVPLGSLCLTAQVLQDIGVRSCSYPFDWMFANLDIVTDALADGFVAFLDESQYVDIGHPEACGHARYGRLFNHHDPLRNPEHHSYFVRCVERLYDVFRSPERKLFLVIDPNFRGGDAELRHKLEVLDWVLRANTCEHELLFVKNTPVGEGGDPRVETVFEFGSVKVANAFTTSGIDGVYYENAIDNETIMSYLLGSYEFVRPASVSPEFMTKK